METVHDGAEYQSCGASVMDARQMVTLVNGDQGFRPRAISWRSGLYGVSISKRMFTLLPCDVSSINHIHVLGLGSELLGACITWSGLVTILVTTMPLLSAAILPACLITQQFMFECVAGLSRVP